MSANPEPSKCMLSYYRRKFYKGKTFFARAVDFVFLRFVAGTAAFLWFSSQLDNTVLVAVLSIAALAVFCVLAALVRSIRFDGFIKKERLRIYEKLYTERLVILDKQSFSRIVKEYIAKNSLPLEGALICVSQCAAKLSDELMLRILRKARRERANKLIIFCISGASDEAKALPERYKFSAQYIGAKALKPFAHEITPTDDDIDCAILESEKAEKKKKAVSSPLNPIKAKRYWFVAFALFAASFFVRYALYYRILGGACLCFAMLAQQFRREEAGL